MEATTTTPLKDDQTNPFSTPLEKPFDYKQWKPIEPTTIEIIQSLLLWPFYKLNSIYRGW